MTAISSAESTAPRRIAIITDAWHPQVNGVVNTLTHTGRELRQRGHEVLYVTPEGLHTLPCPTYPEIRLSLWPGRAIRRRLEDFRPTAIHIATEGPLGAAARRYCLRRRYAFTTSFHTQFPEYLRARAPVPLSWSYAWLRRFHRPAAQTMVPTESQRERLRTWGFERLIVWSRGVDGALFGRVPAHDYGLPRPIFLNVGRVAVEKNIEAFLDLDLPGSKVVIGDGPDLPRLRSRYPAVHFPGRKLGRDLAAHVAGADVFVFPSRTDTFGLVLLEAMACGLQVAAYPVTGPLDVVDRDRTGILDEDLRAAAVGAMRLRRADCVAHAARYSWASCTDTFLSNLTAMRPQHV